MTITEKVLDGTGKGQWVLIVEDEAEVADILCEGLEKAGYRVVKAAHVAEANAKLTLQKFDCIVTDLCLGRGDGSQVIAGVRASRGINAQAPILLMSAHLNIDLVRELRPMINSVLVKPFDIHSFVARIASLVEGAANEELARVAA
jgi:two-component system copper resistance phosphate regulon response regulator CusR